ncbi:programmed cell death protein 2-like isoform X1 [Selaginella moellendorffii]|uniref:programmed cell death protein 2-like isoform X1 n=1 Tax=Selaginella moellendorffii TaxID=88036 RepID=UPI000D1D08A1|nr:programmed cell death protein 2-like isoform X1 [Selaginella moellendorffii]|eukprot:XP_024535237.1 programmed cell death protein 2-like isoform X1 [Selaginella moellendorffii]
MGRPLPAHLTTVDARQENENVVLGMPGPWAEDNQEMSDHYTSKVGGLPDWPLDSDEIDSSLLKCSVCGGELGLVAQVYAPLSINNTKIEERVLFIFGCPTSSCGISPLSWRTLRLQKDGPSSPVCSPASDTPSTSTGESGDDAEASSARDDQNSNDWWEDDSSWAPIAQAENGEEAGSMGLHELEEALLEAGYAAAARPQSQASTRHEIRESNEDEPTSSEEITEAELPVLPCFYIYSQNESHPCRGSRAVSALQNSERLVDFGLDASTGTDSAPADECWEGEEYEHDRTVSADRTYLKFKKRLDCYPEQCYRYSFGGRALLANKDQGDPGVCSLCRGPRVYEMQLMPPLLYYLQQACKDLPSTSYGPNDWEWLTVIIYTCAQSCSRPPQADGERKSWIVVEEATILQYET